MPDMSKPSHLQDLINNLESKKRQCWDDSRRAKLMGEMYEQFASDLRYAVEKEEKVKQASATAEHS